ncbi:unnamed protein product [Blepharisma stoltei]|uniref:Uncharacterized protein n=1 Tax=Blepharisma stoltei TaxID=1481888 RepID=A0AAU9JKM2_9CILI|nr:unnamed protein product [Blepharisma stoltei]
MCFDYCPYGYEYDYSFNQCSGTPGLIASINFDDNLSGKIEIPGIKVQFGMEGNDYYPNFYFLDPYPANKRGLYFDGSRHATIEEMSRSGELASLEFTIEIWAMPLLNLYKNYLFSALSVMPSYKFSENLLTYEDMKIYFLEFFTEHNVLKFTIKTKENDSVKTAMILTDNIIKEWKFYSVSLSFNSLSKTSQVLLLRNTNYYTETISSYYKEPSSIGYRVGNGNFEVCAFNGYIYSFEMYNYGKSYSEIIQGLGTCSSCSACPVVLNSCLPNCDKDEYADENGACQKCSSKCSWICSRADTCNLCYDDLCYKCTKYEIGACTQCVAHAVLADGKCKCQKGYISQDNECVNTCGDGHYIDLKTEKCLRCPDNCLRCNDGDSCIICKSSFALKNRHCSCPDGYFIGSSNKCLKCDNSCLTCSENSSNCTSCGSNLPVLYESNKCYPCDSFEGYSTYFAVSISYFTDDLFSKLSSNCIEVCGDGRNMGQSQCDDGNNRNGDGCSSSCAVEIGWSCFGGSANSPDVCKDITPPTPVLAYLSENSSGYLLILAFSEAVNFGTEVSKNIKIEIKNTLKFNWSIMEKNSLYIITLNMHENVSAGTSVKVTFKNPSSIVDMNGNEMKESSASTNLLESFVYTTGEAIKSSVTTATTVTAASSAIGSLSVGFLMGSFNFQALWSMVEIMQIQNYLIFLSPKYPDNLISYLEALGIANGNFLPNPFQLYFVKNDPFSDPPQKFIDQNYNTDFLMNSGQFILVWVLILLGFLIALVLYKYWPRFSIIRNLKNSYSFSVLLRTGIESFLEITLSVLLQLREFSHPSQDIGYISLTLSILTLVYLVLTFVLIFWQVTLKSKQTLNMKMHERQFGSLYEGFKRDSKLSASFILFQNSRRVLCVAFCVFLCDYATAQMVLSVTLSFMYTISLILLKPFKSLYLGNGLHISCEIFYFIAHCFILKLLDDKISDDYRENLGWAIISLLGMSLLLHIISILIVQTLNLIKGIKQFSSWFMKNFANKFVEIRKRIILLNKIKSNEPTNNAEDISESMAYFEGKPPEKSNEESICSLRSTGVRTSDTLFINTHQNQFEITEKEV